MAGLLVSVRSAEEARAALAGGAAVVDVKEPARGPLGRAEFATWRAVREAVPAETPVSVALGELVEWRGAPPPPPAVFAGLAYRKLGLAGAGPTWRAEWAALRAVWGAGPAWVAVAYARPEGIGAPPIVDVLDEAGRAGCAGLLLDTWDKSRAGDHDPDEVRDLIDRARRLGLFFALAGRLDRTAIARLAPLGPALFAVRGAACRAGDRLNPVEADRVAALVQAARTTGSPGPG